MQVKFKDLNEMNVEEIIKYCRAQNTCKECKNANYCESIAMFPYTSVENVETDLKNLPFLKELNIEILDKEIELTDNEKIILNNLPSQFNYIARDKNDLLYVYEKKPIKDNVNECYYASMVIDDLSLHMYKHLFKSITWESGAYCFREIKDKER